MTTSTPEIGLFKYDTIQDANQTFNITKALNENWDKIDEALNNLKIEIITDLDGKAGKDLSNITQSAKELITSFSVPDYDKGILGPELNTSRTVPYDALVTVEVNINKTYSGLHIYMRNPDGLYISLAHPAGTAEKMYFIGSNQGTSQMAIIPLWVTVPKGFTYHIECGSTPQTYRIKEYPLKGASNE